ncbi:MAG: LysR family transcriptional regulator [Sphingomonadales bacterium]|nr:LysR family transcriptional regulator [Sphingomonadales bacterium]
MPKFHENFLLSRLKLRQLRLLTAIADEGTVLKGSQALNIAQPAATKSIKELEDALGVQLFERSSRGVTPTDFGHVMIKHAKLILAQLRHAGEELQSLEEGLSGRVHVGTLLAASTSLLPRALARLRERRPGIAVTVAEGTIDRLMPGLRTGDIDVVLGRLPEYREREGLKQEVLYLDTVSIMVREGHPLATRASLTLADLVDQAWVMPPTQTSLRRQIDQAFRHEDLEPPLDVIESVSILTNHALLVSTDMLAAMPHQVGLSQAGLTALPVTLEGAGSRIGATMHANVELSAAAAYFMTVVHEVAAEIRDELGQDQSGLAEPRATRRQTK